MKLNNTLICILLLVTLTTCTKFGKNIYVDGYVRNSITGNPVPNISLRLYRSQMDWKDPVGSTSKTLKTVMTDENGYYKIEYLSTLFNKAYVQIGDGVEGGYILLSGENTTQIKKGKRNHLNFEIVPYGYLQINIHNISCFDGNDELKIYRTHSIPGFYDNVPNPATYIGCLNQTGNVNKSPMGWYKYSGTVTKNGIVTPKKDSIYLNEGETKIWSINY